MSFDKFNSADLATLKSEIIEDSAGLYSSANTNVNVSAINSVEMNPTAARLNLDISKPLGMKMSDLSGIISASDYDTLSAYDREWVKSALRQPMETDIDPYKNRFFSIFPPGTATYEKAIAMLSKKPSRGEELFGLGTVITRLDWIAARDS